MFRFGSPYYFLFLLAIPLLIGVYAIWWRARKKRMLKFGDPATVSTLMPEASPKRVIRKFVIFLVALVFIIIALARPQFGSKLKEMNREGIELMLAVDVSNSMLAQDFEPNRLERTKFAISRLLDGLKQDKVGLIVFAGDAVMQLPITSDYSMARTFVDQVSPNMISRQGTAIGSAITMALSSFSQGSEGSRVLVIISDGENHDDDAIAAARKAKERGVTIYTIGIGTPEGAPIPGPDGDFLRDQDGNMVVTKLDEKTLEQIAFETGGAYIRANKQSIGLSEIVDKINETQKKKLTTTVFEEYSEQYQYFLGFALMLLLLEFFILPRKNSFWDRFRLIR